MAILISFNLHWCNGSWDWTPSKKQKKYYSGKKKRHTLKIQIIADEKKKDILRIAVSGGSKHDFRLFKESRFIIPETAFIIADKGYQGISDIHFRSLIPVKATKNHKLNDLEKAFNSDLSKRRIFIEHINRYIKRFRILSSRYRNKRRKFTLRVSLICSIYNFQHSFWGFRTSLIYFGESSFFITTLVPFAERRIINMNKERPKRRN